jgi:peptide/nickel transport system substrate-binding protein
MPVLGKIGCISLDGSGITTTRPGKPSPDRSLARPKKSAMPPGWMALVLGSAVLCACAPPRAEADPGVMVITEEEQTAAFIRNFNPLVDVGNVRWPTKRAMYEPMIIHNTITGEYVPWLAESWNWAEGSERLVFELRKGVRWSDGESFDTADVVFTFNLLREHPGLDARGLWTYLEEVEASGPHQVTFTFARPYVPGLADIGHQVIVPEHLWKTVENPISFANEHPVATGPFTEITSFQTQVYQVGRNPHYWQEGKPAVRALRFPAFPANDQTNLSLIDGEVDWAGQFVPAIDRVFVSKNPEHHHYWFPTTGGTVMLYPNTTVEPFDDPEVRKAISMAIDRELVVKIAMHGYTRPADATGLSDAYTRYRNEQAVAAGDWVIHDPSRAASMLDAAGIRRDGDGMRQLQNGEPFEVTIIVPAGFSDWVRAAQVIVKNLEVVGVEVSLKTYDFGAWYEKLQVGDYTLALGWTLTEPSPYSLYWGLMSSASYVPIGEPAPKNWHRFKHPRADTLLGEFERATDLGRQQAILDELQMLHVEHAPVIPLFPGAEWGEFNSERFTGFPDADHPYAPLGPNLIPQALLVVTRVEPR